MNQRFFLKDILAPFIFFSLLLAQHTLFAQQDLLLYNMEAIPQRMYTNPALSPSSKVNIGLPVISSEYINLGHSGFKYTDLIKHRADDSLYVDYNNMLSKLAKNNYILMAFRPDLLSFGFKNKKNYFSFNATEKFDFRFRYPKSFMEFIWKGNGALLDREVNLNFGINFSHYREYGFGFAREVNDKLKLGGKLKYLNGFSNIWTEKTDISLITESSYFAITAKADVLIHSAGFDSSATDNFSAPRYMKNKNPGAGIDLGGVYKVSDKFSFSASVIDFGFIRWKDHVMNYESSGAGSFTYQGIDAGQLIKNKKLKIDDLLSNLVDSISKAIKIDSTYTSYTTWLNTKMHLASNYYFTPKSNAGILFYSQFYEKQLHPGLALSYNQRVGRWFGASASYAMYNRSYNNIGFGLSLNGGPLQLYVVSDNILGAVFPQAAKNIHIHFGINLTLGRPRKDKDKDGIPDKKDACPTIPGLQEFNGCPDKDGDHVTDSKDDCPDIAGKPEFNGCPDRDGDKLIDKKDSCPDIAGLIELNGCPDRDGDKVIDELDLCPDDAGLITFFGCPDTDHDKVIDTKDACPNDSGSVAMKGCPDVDGDLTTDKEDRCPTVAGPIDNQGCPLAKLHLLDRQGKIISSATVDKAGRYIYADVIPNDSLLMKLESYDGIPINEITVVVGQVSRIVRRGTDEYFRFETLPTDKNKLNPIEIPDVQIKLNREEAQTVKHAMETLEFDSGSDVIRTSSSAGLDLVAKLLMQNQAWRLKLSGHTDNKATLKFNINLSKKRVEAIKNYMVKKGVKASHIVLKWFGSTKPIATNATEEGRQKNRRVEFLIIQ
jgi:outer membrane protein OmpA-like peptidoglycan-associated protein